MMAVLCCGWERAPHACLSLSAEQRALSVLIGAVFLVHRNGFGSACDSDGEIRSTHTA